LNGSSFLWITRNQSSASKGLQEPAKVGGLVLRKSRQLVIHVQPSWLLINEGIGQCLQYEGLVVDFSSVLAYFLFFLRKVLFNRLCSGTSGCGVPATGGPRDVPGSHLLIG
jgi:hypothetical protein